MNDEAAFVAAIAAAPDDTNLPLIFADWLDDRGDPRGQWIRSPVVHPWMRPAYDSPVPRLLESLRNNKRVLDVRKAAAVVGAPLVSGLVELLTHEAPRVRQQACMCLRRIGRPAKDAVPALMDALADPDPGVRAQAATALEDVGAKEAADTDRLKTALTDGNWRVRQAASKVLGSMRAKASVLQELVEMFATADAAGRVEVLEGLAQLGTADVVPALDAALDDPAAAVREAAVAALGRLKLPAVEAALCRAMRNKLARVRAAAAEQYRWQQPLGPEVVAALVPLLDDPVPDVRYAGCGALARAGDLARPAVPRLIALLNDLSPEVNRSAMKALADVATGDPAALAALTGELANPDPGHRRLAARAVAAVGAGHPSALAALTPLVSDPDGGVADVAARGLIEGWERLPAALAPALLANLDRAEATDGYGNQVAAALAPLGQLENPPAAVVDRLRALVNSPLEGVVARTASDALGRLGPAAAAAVPDLVGLFRQPEPGTYYTVYHAAARALVRIGAPGVGALAALLDERNVAACWYVLQGIRELGADARPLVPALRRMLVTSTEEYERGRVLEALRALGPHAADALPDVLAAIDGVWTVNNKLAAVHALQDFGPAVLPHVPALLALARRPEFADHLGTFATVFERLAPAPEVRELLRELLRLAAPAAGDDWNRRWNRVGTRQTCANALLKYNDPALLPDLAPLLADPEVSVRRAFLPRVAALDSPLVVPLLRQALTDEDDEVRVKALAALAGRTDPSDETLAALVRALEDRLPKVRRGAADALGKLGVSTPAVLAGLTAAAEDADAKTAERARVARRKLSPKPGRKDGPPPAKGRRKSRPPEKPA